MTRSPDLPDVEVLVWDRHWPGAGRHRAHPVPARPLHGRGSASEALAALPELEFIQLLSAGVAPWLDRVPPGVTLCNGRGVHGGSTAELAVAGLLSLLRALPEFGRDQAEGRWHERWTDDLDGAEVVLLGAGDINQRGCRPRWPVRRAVHVRRAHAPATACAAVDDLPDLLPTARAVVLALPLTDETRRPGGRHGSWRPCPTARSW